MEKSGKHIFVTVGTTLFNELIDSVTQYEFLVVFLSHNFSSMTIQLGKGKHPKLEKVPPGFSVEYYDYKNTLNPDMKKADLIISHCGAGCVTESLRNKKPVIAVVNESLSGNHQNELANKFFEKGNILKTTPNEILKLVSGENFIEKIENLKEMEEPETQKWAKLVYKEMGI